MHGIKDLVAKGLLPKGFKNLSKAEQVELASLVMETVNREQGRRANGKPSGTNGSSHIATAPAARLIDETCREEARKHAEEAIGKLVTIMRRSKNDIAKVEAIRELLDRAYGKAPQPLHLSPAGEATITLFGR